MEAKSTTPEPAFDRRRMAGALLILGDLMLGLRGLAAVLFTKHEDPTKEKELKEAGWGLIKTAGFWSLGGFVLAKYGKRPTEQQMEKLEAKLAAHLQENGVALDDDLTRKAQSHKNRGLFEKLEDFLYTYPTEVMNAWFGGAATFLVSSGIKSRRNADSKENKKAGLMQAIQGGLVMSGGLFGILVPEKTAEQLEREGKSSDSLWAKIQRQPLSWASKIFMGNNAFGVVKSYQTIRHALNKNRTDINPKLDNALAILAPLEVGSYIASNLLSGTSSKKAGGSPEERSAAQEELIARMADMLAGQPEESRANAAAIAADYLAKQPELRMLDSAPEKLAEKLLSAATTKKTIEPKPRPESLGDSYGQVASVQNNEFSLAL